MRGPWSARAMRDLDQLTALPSECFLGPRARIGIDIVVAACAPAAGLPAGIQGRARSRGELSFRQTGGRYSTIQTHF
eukprot:COSAG02_NODE_54721_length_294_cov_1.169231_1_plen_77_part_10